MTTSLPQRQELGQPTTWPDETVAPGDRAGLDDPAMVAGIGSIDGVTFMLIGHQKGRNTKVCIRQASCSTSTSNPGAS